LGDFLSFHKQDKKKARKHAQKESAKEKYHSLLCMKVPGKTRLKENSPLLPLGEDLAASDSSP
jgi:hypothetical protein